MNTYFYKIILLFFLTSIVCASGGSQRAYAATVTFDPQETTVGPTSPFLIGITLESKNPINALQISVRVPYPLKVVDFSDGDSIINFWTDRPHIDNNGNIQFSGIIPGGFVGKGSRLLVLKVQAPEVGDYTISLDPASVAYVNSPDNLTEPITSSPVHLSVVTGRDNLVNEVSDVDPPEPFTPMVVNFPKGQLYTESAAKALLFSSNDKGSGIAGYETAESWYFVDPQNQKQLAGLEWRTVESPYMITDQQLQSYLYVRAIDKKGNQRVAMISPTRAWWSQVWLWCILVIVLCLLFLM